MGCALLHPPNPVQEFGVLGALDAPVKLFLVGVDVDHRGLEPAVAGELVHKDYVSIVFL